MRTLNPQNTTLNFVSFPQSAEAENHRMETLRNHILPGLVVTLILLTSYVTAETHYHQFVV